VQTWRRLTQLVWRFDASRFTAVAVVQFSMRLLPSADVEIDSQLLQGRLSNFTFEAKIQKNLILPNYHAEANRVAPKKLDTTKL